MRSTRQHRRAKPADFALPFQPDAVEIEDGLPQRRLRLVMLLLVALGAAVLVWASLARVDRVVTAPGRLITATPPIEIRPWVSASIARMPAGPGDEVAAGEPLVVLDTSHTASARARLRDRLVALTAQAERLRAEIEGRDFALETDMAGTHGRVQTLLFARGRARLEAELGASRARVRRLTAEIDKHEAVGQVQSERLAVTTQLAAIHGELAERRVGRRSTALRADRERLSALESRTEAAHDVGTLEAAIAAEEARRETLLTEWAASRVAEFQRVLAEIEKLGEDLIETHARHARAVLSAPVDAVVLAVGEHGVGSAAREGETLLKLSPRDAPLLIEVDVAAADIARIRVGDTARVKLKALPFQRHGTLTARVRDIGEDTHETAPGVAAYRTVLELTAADLRAVPADHRLRPGMRLEAEIRIGERRVVDYLAYPLIRTLDEALREP
jgi:HlyD family secretion protein